MNSVIKLIKFGFKVIFIGRDVMENIEIECGLYDFVYGSLEMFLVSMKWCEMLKLMIY